MNTTKIKVRFAESNTTIKANFGVVHNVNTPFIPEGYLKPEGVLDITENGSYDVTNYAKALVAVKGRDIVAVSIREV